MSKMKKLLIFLLFGGTCVGLYFGIAAFRGVEDGEEKGSGKVSLANEKDESEAARLGMMRPELADRELGDFKESETVKGDKIHRFRPQPKKPQVIVKEAPRQPQPEPQAEKASAPKDLPALVHSFSSGPSREALTKDAPDIFAPSGTLIPCQLVLTVDSSSLETPILGLVTDDVFHNGELIVPAGTEVHGFASTGRVRNRIEVKGSWTLVWQDGKQYQLSGIALDREKNPDGEGWGITDGSAGIRGKVLKSDEYLELKLFAATFFEGVASNSQETTATIFGPVPDNNIANGGLEGLSEVGETYADILLERLRDEGYFVRVATGTEFYIYVTQVIEPELASVAGLTQNESTAQSWELKEQAFRNRQAQLAKHQEEVSVSETTPEKREQELKVQQALQKRETMLKAVEQHFNRQNQ